MSQLLPAEFSALEPFVARWALPSAAARTQARSDSTEAERVAFFNAMKDVVPDALAFLDAKPLNQFDDAEQRLMQLALSFAHVALAVEIQRDDEPKHARNRQYLHITTAPADQRAG